MPGCASDARSVTAVEPDGVARTSVLVVNGTGLSTSPAAARVSGYFVLAAAYTSACAPSWIWVASSSEPANENSTFAPGFAAENAAASFGKASFSDDAAKTRRVPPPAGAPEATAALVAAAELE